MPATGQEHAHIDCLRIVGNVTLLESPIHARYLVANVAVHPDFRRRGIARALMHEALAHIESWHGHQVYLQVESDNRAALALYDSMAFERRGEVRRWQTTISKLRLPSPEQAAGPRVRSLRSREWRAARELDRIAETLSDIAVVEQRPGFEGRTMLMIMAPNTGKKPK